MVRFQKTFLSNNAKFTLKWLNYEWNKTYSSSTENSKAMANSLSGLLAEIFMSSFEIKLKAELWFPRIWYRHVNDVFAICFNPKIDLTLDKINK